MSKFCICLTGQMRTYEDLLIINSYKKYLSIYKIIDLYIFTWNNKGFSNHHGTPIRCNTENNIITENILMEHYSQFNFFNIKKIIIDDFNEWYNNLNIEMKNIFNTPFRNHSNVTTSLPIEYKYQQITYYLDNDYENVMVLRPDMSIVCHLSILNPVYNTIYFKSICERCMDHVWFGNKKTIVKQLNNIFDNYLINYNKITSNNENNRDNNELLFYQCQINNIKIIVTDGMMVQQILYS